MRLVYYTHPAFLEPALCLARELARDVELHLLLEISPGAWQTAGFDLVRRRLPAGLVAADPVLKDAFPAGVRRYWEQAASFHLVVHPSRRSLHPRSWTISRKVLRFAASHGDILHVDDVDVSPRLPLAMRGWRRPLVIAVHDAEPHTGERHWRKGLARRLAYPAASAFVMYNGAFRDAFAARHGVPASAIETTRLGTYEVCREFRAPAAAAPPTVLFFGRLSAYKGLDVFYEAARAVAARVPGVTFVVAGRPVEGYVPPVPPPLPEGASVQLLDRYLTNAETAALFTRASVVVCPYRDATQSGVVLTAFAFRVPVVATDVGGLPEYVLPGRTGLLVPIGDAQATADAVCRILGDGDLAGRLRAGIADAAADDLSWHATAATLLRIYRRHARG